MGETNTQTDMSANMTPTSHMANRQSLSHTLKRQIENYEKREQVEHKNLKPKPQSVPIQTASAMYQEWLLAIHYGKAQGLSDQEIIQNLTNKPPIFDPSSQTTSLNIHWKCDEIDWDLINDLTELVALGFNTKLEIQDFASTREFIQYKIDVDRYEWLGETLAESAIAHLKEHHPSDYESLCQKAMSYFDANDF